MLVLLLLLLFFELKSAGIIRDWERFVDPQSQGEPFLELKETIENYRMNKAKCQYRKFLKVQISWKQLS